MSPSEPAVMFYGQLGSRPRETTGIEGAMADRRIEGNFSQGWGVAAFITLLAVGAFTLAGVIKKTTYHSPNDTMAPAAQAESH